MCYQILKIGSKDVHNKVYKHSLKPNLIITKWLIKCLKSFYLVLINVLLKVYMFIWDNQSAILLSF